MPEIGTRIKRQREKLGMTQEELANALGYKSKTTIAKIEKGTNDFPQKNIYKFANVLQVTPSFLMGLEEDFEVGSEDFEVSLLVKNPSFKKKLKKILKDKKISLSVLSKKINISEDELKDIIENPNQRISSELMAIIAIALDVDIVELLDSERMDFIDFSQSISFFDHLKYSELKELFDRLNELGRKTAIERIRELSYIPMYSKTPDMQTNNHSFSNNKEHS